jgi:spore coat protein A
MLTRRRLLEASAAVATGIALAGPRPAAGAAPARPGPYDPALAAGLTRYVDPLPVPPVWFTASLAQRGLTAREGVHRFHRQLGTTRTWGYGGLPYLGPTIMALRDRPVSFDARNRLGRHLLGVDESLHGPHGADDQNRPRMSLHLHGGYVEARSDGHPELTFLPGQSYRYRYSHDQETAPLIYHDHALGITRLNVYAGLAGVYLIRDLRVEAGLPPPRYDLPLVLQDKSFLGSLGDPVNELSYPDPWAPEFFGDVALVNGAAWPNLDVARGVYRFRIVNASSSRFYHLALSDGRPFRQIGTDGGLLNRPLPQQTLLVAPGERLDALVDFSADDAGTELVLQNRPLPPGVESPADIEINELMRFTVTSGAGWPSRFIPAELRRDNPLGALPAARRARYLTLVEIMGTDGPVMALLNNRRWDTTDRERPKVDTVEEWNLINLTEDTHPIHLHLVQFQLKNRQPIDAGAYLSAVYGGELTEAEVGTGPWPAPRPDPAWFTGPPRPPSAGERGWKDTVQVHPGQVTRLLVPFGPSAAPGLPFGHRHRDRPFTGDYVWHCHILDHEDNEMMLPYRVTG